jgi:hypothetical protein
MQATAWGLFCSAWFSDISHSFTANPFSVSVSAHCRVRNARRFSCSLQGLLLQCASQRHRYGFGLLRRQYRAIADLTIGAGNLETPELGLDGEWVRPRILLRRASLPCGIQRGRVVRGVLLTSIRLGPEARDIAREPVSVLALQPRAASQSHPEREEASL